MRSRSIKLKKNVEGLGHYQPLSSLGLLLTPKMYKQLLSQCFSLCYMCVLKYYLGKLV